MDVGAAGQAMNQGGFGGAAGAVSATKAAWDRTCLAGGIRADVIPGHPAMKAKVPATAGDKLVRRDRRNP